MGHTVPSQRIVIDKLLGELQDLAKALREEDRVILNDLLHDPLKHIGSITYASSMHVWAFLLLSIWIEHEKRHRCVPKWKQAGSVEKGKQKSRKVVPYVSVR
jgi:hypothetical protein